MLEILYRDTHIAVVLKRAGLLSEGESKDSLPSLLSAQLSTPVFPVHRLDRSTEGIVVYALSSAAAAVLSRDIAEGKWQKLYLADICGVPDAPSGRLCDLLYYDRARGKAFAVDRLRKGVKEAILDYRLVSVSPDRRLSRIEVSLLTGRTHQIRVQFASRGMPLCGDRRYGAPSEYGSALALCAYKLSFPHPKTGQLLSFESEPSNLKKI